MPFQQKESQSIIYRVIITRINIGNENKIDSCTFQVVKQNLRPTIEQIDYSDGDVKYINLMIKCWDNNYLIRPNSDEVHQTLKTLHNFKSN